MQISRLFEIVYILIEKKKVTTTELANYFEVSKRTIIRDIEILVVSGIPIYTIKGRNGGICIMENYVLNKTVISNEEQNRILMGLQTLKSMQCIHIEDTLRKLTSLFSKSEEKWVEFDFSHWGNKEVNDAKFTLLSDAILHKETISFLYYDSHGNAERRKVNPIKLIFKSKDWYLQAYCQKRNGYRTFKLCRMYEIEDVGEFFTDTGDVVPIIDQYEETYEKMAHIELLFEKSMAYRVYDEFSAEYVRKNEDGSYSVTIDLPEGDWLYSLLLSFGPKVQIITPERVKKEVLKRANQIIQKNI